MSAQERGAPRPIRLVFELSREENPRLFDELSQFRDVIQLSAQRMAIEDELRATIANEAYVLVPRGHRGTSLVPLPVRLMARQEVEDLMRRREAMLRGLIEPRWPANERTCSTCGFRERCGRAPSAEP